MAQGEKMKNVTTDNYSIYNGDCVEFMHSMPDNSIDFSIYSPPFGGLFCYSSDDRDLSNTDNYNDFFTHYDYVVKEKQRITKPGRCTAVHCMMIPSGNTGCDHFIDFPGDIIKLHQKNGFHLIAEHIIWKEPLMVRNKTMQKNLAHKTVAKNSIYCGVAVPDRLLIFRNAGECEIPVTHDHGLTYYAGENQPPAELLHYKGYVGDQKKNRYSHYIWRQYASSVWMDIRNDPKIKMAYCDFKEAREDDDEKHIHPLQLDVIVRSVELRSNPGEVVFTPFMGVGSEVYGAVMSDRRGIGVELKESYYNQAIKNLQHVEYIKDTEQSSLGFDYEK